MKDQTLAQASEKELIDKVSEMGLELVKLRSELSSKAASNKVGQIHNLKKNVARALTFLNQKKRQAKVAQIKKQESVKKA